MPNKPSKRPRSWSPDRIPGAKPARFPRFILPSLAALRTEVPAGAGFVHELKLDGYRIQSHLRDGRVKLYTRSGIDWTNRLPTIAAEVASLPAKELVIDGEIVSAEAEGRTSFSALQDDLKQARHDRMVYYSFDLLHLDGFVTRAAPLVERKRALQSVLSDAGTTAPHIFYSEHFEDGAELYARASEMGFEGIVSKKASAPYRSGRTPQWLKVKCWKQECFAVVGFVPEGSTGLLKLRLARRDANALVYVGRVGTGWDRETARAIRSTLEPLARPTSPVPLTKSGKIAGTIWVEPRFDAEIRYSEITDDGMMRHPSFKRLLS